MSEPAPHLAAEFPPPSPAIIAVLDELRLAAVVPPDSEEELRRLAVLDRPWDPAGCDPDLRSVIYRWLEDVVAWINEEHSWRTDRVIPPCWMEHPHIVHELATVACLRWEARYAVTPVVLEEWHRTVLPFFLERIAQRIGESGCPPGRHQRHPAAVRNARYRGAEESSRRRRRRAREGRDAAPLEAKTTSSRY